MLSKNLLNDYWVGKGFMKVLLLMGPLARMENGNSIWNGNVPASLTSVSAWLPYTE